MVTLILNKTLAIKTTNMKKIISIPVMAFLLLLSLSGCIKNDPVLVEGAKAEFDATALNTNAVGLTYPILIRIPAFGRVVSAQSTSTDSILRRFSGTIQIRVNLVGVQSSKAETVGFDIVTTSPITSIRFDTTIRNQFPTRSPATVNVLQAIAGTHYSPITTSFIEIPANSSFGFLTLNILNPGSSPDGRYFGLKLNDKGTIKPSVNYSELGLVIDQR